MKTIVWIGLILLSPVLAAQAQTPGDSKVGKSTYAVCAGCHGFKAEGNRGVLAPKLAGQEDWYLERQMHNFRAGIRGGDPADRLAYTMHQMAAALKTDADIANVIAYIRAQPDKAPPQFVEGDAKRGESLYVACAACHGSAGEGNPALNSPALAGMSDWYLVEQLMSFREGRRGTHPDDTYGMQMAPMAGTLPDAQALNDVVRYISTLPGRSN